MINGLMDAWRAMSEPDHEVPSNGAGSAGASASHRRGTPLSPREARSAGRPPSPGTETVQLLAPRAALPAPSSQLSTYQSWQERAKNNTVMPGTYSPSRVGKELVTAFGGGLQACVGALGGVGATVMLASVVSGRTSEEKTSMDHQLLALAAGPALAAAATSLLSDVVGAFRKGYLTQPEALRETFKKYVADSAEELEKRPPHIQEPIHTIDLVLNRLCAQIDKGEDIDTARFDRLLKWRQEFLMAMDSSPKVVQAWTTREGRAELREKIREAVKTFPEEVRNNLETILTRIAANSVVGNTENHRRLQFRFKGPGGTGKDTFIGIIGKTLDLPVIELVVPPERDGGVEALLGNDWAAIEQAHYAPSDEELFGSLGLALVKSGHSNVVVYLNEIKLDEQGVVNGLKRLLDPAKDSIEFKSLSTKIDWSHQTIFVASNDNVNPDAALESRWETIELPRATRETKQAAAMTLHDLESLNYKRILRDGYSVLNTGQQKMLDEIFKAVLPLLLDEHDKKFPGARMDFARSVTTFIADKLERRESPGQIKKKTARFIVDFFKKIQAPAGAPPAADDDEASIGSSTGESAESTLDGSQSWAALIENFRVPERIRQRE